MTLFANSGPRGKVSAKFRPYSKMGLEKSTGGQYRDWHYSFVAHQTGSGVRRTRYAVSISDPNKNRVEYLRDFSSLEQATTAAKQWIDQKANWIQANALPRAVGTIPTPPTSVAAQEK